LNNKLSSELSRRQSFSGRHPLWVK